jgi:hypothetical protein
LTESATTSGWKRWFHALIAAEVSAMTRYFDRVVQWGRVRGDDGSFLELIECAEKSLVEQGEQIPDLSGESDRRTAVLLNGVCNYSYDIEGLLRELRPRLSRSSRVILVLFNPYLDWLYRFAVRLGLKSGDVPTTFITNTDVDNLCRLSGFERVRTRAAGYIPLRLLGLGSMINALLPAVPLLRHLALTNVITLRSLLHQRKRPSLAVVIPARNEKGNVENALLRMPSMDADLEIIFVEGHSSDGTWEEIERVREAYADRFRIRSLRQTGKGKADAVRLGFANATSDLLTILDADLTMPPELLPRFLEAYVDGRADFINGNRIVYPMEGDAMRFLNRLGNVFFAKALTAVLGVRVGDSLCGTKLVARHDYARFIAWRRDFGDFDPFGDFELIYPAADLGLGIVDVPIRYRARTYGSTNISRFRHGAMLLKMTLIGLVRLKLGRLPRSGS